MSAIDTAGNVSLSGQRHDVDRSLKEKKWEEVQIKAFTSWLNSILSSRGLEVKNLTEDLKDGLHLVNLCEVTSGKLLKGIDKRPHIPIQKINNINIALNFLRNDLNVRLDLIGAEDVFSGNLKMILGMIFAIFRKVVHGKIGQLTGASESESQEVGLLRWIREQTDGYDGVKIVDFRSSFNDGLAFNALVHRFDANLFDYDAIDKADKAENLKRAFALAEKHLGVPQLLDVNDLLSGDADERSIILYSSLYFHAFVSNEERRKAMGVQEGLTHQIEDTKTKLSTTERQLEEALSRAQGLTQDNADLLARIAKLEEQLGFYQKARQTDAETMDLLSEKVNVLGTLLADEKNTRSATEQARFQLQQEIEELNRRLTQTEQLSEHEIEELRKRLEMLRDKEETERKELELARKKLAETSEDFERALEEAEARKRELGEQIAGLRRSVAEEKEIRRQREAEVQQLRQECQQLKKSAVSQGRARHGLGLLKRNLEEHLEDMYKWRQLHHGSVEGSRFDLAAVVSETANKTFEQTLTYLDEKLQEENKSLLRIVQLQDNAVQDRIEKEGVLRMKFRKDWSKRYFRLTGNKISWYPEDGNGRREGTVDLTKQCEIVRQKAIKSEEAGISKFWPLKLTVVLQVKQLVDGVETLVDQEKKLFIRAASKKERHAWFSLIAGKIASINYRQALEHESNPRPDTRILTFLQASDDTELFLDGRPVSHQGIIAISKVLAGHDQLKTLSISEAALSAESVAVFSEGVLKSQAIDSISLSKNSISDEAGAALVQRLATLNRITSLNLSHNQLGAATASSLAGSIANFPGLHDLNLSHNRLGSDGVGNLTTALQQNRTPLTALHLAHNNIGPAAAGPIAGLLAASESITSVDLSGNDLGNEGLAALVEGLRSNRSVRSLDLSHTKISSAGLHHLKSLLEANRLLDQVILTHNDLSASDLASFSVAGFVFHDLSLNRHA